MGSRKEEERNEKIIRGLMKLPPNRRCINCNSPGPQYVCTNFWTFVCMACSGIHREFTHRVKSVSMSKFSSQEVEALQNGGNQRAREIYLKNWDPQRQRLSDSRVDKVREFIKSVYVDRRYAGGTTSEKPSNNMQGLGNHEDETRRASSYHSYSQSPPYDYQYEDRRYGKQHASLTRKPGSDRGHYVGKISSFVSPGRMNDKMFEDRFANEGSGSRVSDFSLSGGGDPFRSGAESPNFKKDMGFNSPPLQPSRDISSSMENFRRDVDGIPRPQRTTSLGSFGSLESKSVSLKSYNSSSSLDVISEPRQYGGFCQNKTSSVAQPFGPVKYGGLDLCQAPAVEGLVPSAAAPTDLFLVPATSTPVNAIQTLQVSSAPSSNFHQPPQTSPKSLDFFDIPEQLSTSTLNIKSLEFSDPKNEGWATFDMLSTTSIPRNESLSPSIVPVNGVSSVRFDQYTSFNTTQRPVVLNSGAHPPTPSSDLWFDAFNNVKVPTIATSTQSWKAFDDSTTNLPLEGFEQNFEPKLAANQPSSTADRLIRDSNHGGNQRAVSQHGPQPITVPLHVDTGPLYTPSVLPLVVEKQAHATDLKSTNPFDFPYDSDLEQNDKFLDMSSLHSALPNAQLPSTFLGGVTQSWFSQDPVTPFIPAASQGGLSYISVQAPTSQLQNVPAQEPVASVGGNPFA